MREASVVGVLIKTKKGEEILLPPLLIENRHYFLA